MSIEHPSQKMDSHSNPICTNTQTTTYFLLHTKHHLAKPSCRLVVHQDSGVESKIPLSVRTPKPRGSTHSSNCTKNTFKHASSFYTCSIRLRRTQNPNNFNLDIMFSSHP